MAGNALPELRTERLVLRPYRAADAAWIVRLAGDFEVAKYTGLPHPMDAAAAATWVTRFVDARASSALPFQVMGWALTLAGSGEPIGGISLRAHVDAGPDAEPESGSAGLASGLRLGFWLGRDDWGLGYGLEAARELVRFAFGELQVDSVHADHVAENVASGRILASCGLRPTRVRTAAFDRFGSTHDIVEYAAQRTSWGA